MLSIFKPIEDLIEAIRERKKATRKSGKEYYVLPTGSELAKLIAIVWLGFTILFFMAMSIFYFFWSKTRHLTGKPIRRILYMSMGLSVVLVVCMVGLLYSGLII